MKLKIDIFRPGRHVPTTGEPMSFSEADLAAIAGAYDKALHEAPIVLGHPKTDDPAYGWVETLAFEDGALWATVSDVDPAFAEALQARRYDKRSSAFYGPDSRGNPTPGRFYLRHVGFLGAQPPGCKGLKPIAFAAGEDELVEFAETPAWDLSWALSTLGTMFRRMRDKLIEKASVAEADDIYPDYAIVQLETAAKALRDSAAATTQPAFAEPPPASAAADPAATAALAERIAEVEAREAVLEEREQKAAAERAAARRGEDAAFVEGLVKQGRVSPGGAAAVVAFLQELDDSAAIAFSEGGAATARARFRKLLESAAPIITFAEIGAGDDPPPADAGALAAAAAIYINEQAAKGRTVRTEDAVRHVQKGTAA